MTPAEKNQLLQFMGQTYGHMHKQDQMIVGQAGNLKPGSQELKQSFETAAKLPVQEQYSKPNVPGPPPAPAQAPPVEISTVTPEQAAEQLALPTPDQAAQEIAAQRTIRTEQPQPVDEVDPNQVEFDFSEPTKINQLIDLIKDQNLILKDISLKLDNGKKAPNKKSG
jgi:hypothetical protein|tara:strand:- start:2319 stop:2819 length:501 start_codon:yes stop_codon:yes gene_type:complete